jgi:hypothetical protein
MPPADSKRRQVARPARISTKASAIAPAARHAGLHAPPVPQPEQSYSRTRRWRPTASLLGLPDRATAVGVEATGSSTGSTTPQRTKTDDSGNGSGERDMRGRCRGHTQNFCFSRPAMRCVSLLMKVALRHCVQWFRATLSPSTYQAHERAVLINLMTAAA